MRELISGLLLVLFISRVHSQDEDAITWVNSMDQESINETSTPDKVLYVLRAVYTQNGSSEGIQYGFNNNPTSILITSEIANLRINRTTGEVFINNPIDADGDLLLNRTIVGGLEQITINLIAVAGSLFKRTESVIKVINENDVAPSFVNDSLRATVRENTPVPVNGERLVTDIVIKDVDGFFSNGLTSMGVSVQLCKIRGVTDVVDCPTWFRLVRARGDNNLIVYVDLILLRPLDHEFAPNFQVQLAADDGQNVANTDVQITVLDDQDTPPTWENFTNDVTTQDETPVGGFVIQVLAVDGDTDKRNISYRFLPGQENVGIPIEDVFTIGERSGIITNIVELDLENTTYFKLGKTYRTTWELQISACELLSENPDVRSTAAIDCAPTGIMQVNIRDVNDNPPRFLLSPYEYTIDEDIPNGDNLGDPRIIIDDNDTSIFSKHDTEIVTDSDEFSLIGGTANPFLIVKNTTLIDYDRGPKQYNLTLRTFDVDNPTLEDFVDVFIYVRDVNDNNPNFTQPRYTATIPENSQGGTFVIQIEADDIDSGLMGKDGIRYRLEGADDDLFTINPITGRIDVADCSAGTYGETPCLDYEQKRAYEFLVYASDSLGSSTSRQGSASLVIQLTDVNDNPPEVPDYQVSIFENERRFPGVGFFVKGTDPDEGTVLFYSIRDQSPGAFWQINSITGEITVNKPNNEGIKFTDGNNGSFVVSVSVSDNVFVTISTVRIDVIDTNDNAPVFQPSIYFKDILETTGPDVVLLNVTANDRDDPTSLNGQLEFNIQSGNIGGVFAIDEITGVFSTSSSAAFDFDQRNNFTVIVRVNDRGTPQRDATATIFVRVLNVNNRNPLIDPPSQEMRVLEIAQIGTLIGRVSATDPDTNAVLEYRFTDQKSALSSTGFNVSISDYDYRVTFRIDTSGNVYVNGPLDRTLAYVFTYAVEVEDVAAPTRQTGLGSVIIYVDAFNGDDPVIQNSPRTIFLEENRLPNTFVDIVSATDDEGIDRYTIFEQPHGYFEISPNGVVTTTGPIIDVDNPSSPKSSYFIVEAIDRGEPQRLGRGNITVTFLNVNDLKPQFLRNRLYTATIAENSVNGTPVVQVQAVDDDLADGQGFNEVRYFMNDDRFDVDPITGEVFVRLRNGAELDRESFSRILTQVTAIDNPESGVTNNEPQNIATTNINVFLQDVNDNPPVFTRVNFVQVYEKISIGSRIYDLFTTDLDIGDNAISYYYKISGSDLFEVSLSGRVFTSQSLEGQIGIYRIVVEARDNLGNGLIANTTLTIEVLPVDSTPPEWVVPIRENETISVLEEQYKATLVLDVSAKDADSGENGRIYYSFIYEGEVTQSTPEFTINEVTGVIKSRIIFDRENIDRYVLLLRARDNGDPVLEATRFLTVRIKDVNDNLPIFAESEVEMTANEDAQVGDLIGSVTATDRDLNPVIKYRIISGNEDGIFRIDEDSGVIYLNKALDTELESIYYMDVLATNGEPEYTVIQSRRRRAVDPSIITVKIMVGDVNDLAPQFLEDRYYGCISTRSQLGKHIVTVRAVDRDAVGTGIVRYSLNKTEDGANTVVNSPFAIHPKFGIITNTVLMQSFVDKTYDLTVNARDGEIPAESESSNTNVKIFVTQPGKEVKLLITQNTAEVRLYQNQIQSIIEQSNNIDYLCVIDIQPHRYDSVGSTSALWSDVYVSGVRVEADGSNKILGSRELTNIINFERNSRSNDFDLLYIREVEAASSSDELDLDDKAVIIILIIIAVLIFLVIIFCIVAFMCIKAAKTQKKRRLVEKTNAPPPPAPILMVEAEPEPVPVVYDNRTFVQEVEAPVVQDQEVIAPEPIHVQYAVVQKRSPSPPEQTIEYSIPDPVDDDQVIIVPLDDGEPQRVSVYETQPDNEYRIETEVVQD